MTKLQHLFFATLLLALDNRAQAQTLKIEAARLDTQSAAAKKDREGNYEVRDLKCPDGVRLTMIEAQDSHWGTYRSVTWLRVSCTLPDGIKTTPEAGTRRTPSGGFPGVAPFPPMPGVGACNQADGGPRTADRGQYMTGIRVFDDNYTKNLRVQCGTATVDPAARTFRIGDRRLGSDNILLNQVQNDDRAATLACADDEVLTGLKVRYRKDMNESAFHLFPAVLLQGDGRTLTRPLGPSAHAPLVHGGIDHAPG